MSAVFGNLRRDAEAWGARLALTQLRQRIGGTGLAAAQARPGLLAEVDQHAAAVRDALTEATGGVTVIGLAAYADGVTDSAVSNGWRLPGPDGPDWTAPDWPLVRLLAVCAVAETL
ncbi:DUF6401 family natural product biosynthesis protein [Planosporangium sp. 12N6]|uniref:DUF6401 family natural product biosynthesis protein n=1 Tax=Planosporangium spinosum TaxID=3402278 RepID=UPI003CEE4D9E